MCLSISHRSHEIAKCLTVESGIQKSIKKLVTFNSYTQAIDCMEHIITSIAFAFTALEAFVNETIPDEHVYSLERNDKRCIETYSKEKIERNINLDNKISDVLPPILGVKSPKGTQIWQEYIRLKKI